MTTFNFEALPVFPREEKRTRIFRSAFLIGFLLLLFILNFYYMKLWVVYSFIPIILFILIITYNIIRIKKSKLKSSPFSIGLNDNGITVIDNGNEVFINKSEVYEIIIYFCDIKSEMLGKHPVPSDGNNNTIKIISSNKTIEKRIFIQEDIFYHRFKLLGIRLKEMEMPVKMIGFYEYM